MTIRFSCSCGRTLQVRQDQAGQRIRCSQCREVVTVPTFAEEEAAPLPELAPHVDCPGCKTEWPPETVVCVKCGYNFKTGKKLKTRYKVSDQFIDVGTTWLGTYTRYSVKREKNGRLMFRRRKWWLWLPVGSFQLDLKGYDTVAITEGEDAGRQVAQVAVMTLSTLAGESSSLEPMFAIQLEGPRRKPVRIYASANDGELRQIVDMLQAATGFKIERR
jgi:hypothetical protein